MHFYQPERIQIVDSHTGGEPTRVVLDGGPDLGGGTVAERQYLLQQQFDFFRTAVIHEPRGSAVLVGALLIPASVPDCVTGVIFFNNVGYLGMCGHGTIGVVSTLHHLGRIHSGIIRIETSVGVVAAHLGEDGSVSIANVPSYRKVKDLEVDVPGIGNVIGDVAWGGNWFYLVRPSEQSISQDQIETLTNRAWSIRQAVNNQGYPEVDHIEIFGPAAASENDSRNFVLCPGKEYDRSPCGTGTSAKLACLAQDGKLAEGAEWLQESIVGSVFRGTYTWLDREAGVIAPLITGKAYVTGETLLLFDPNDPYRWGIK